VLLLCALAGATLAAQVGPGITSDNRVHTRTHLSADGVHPGGTIDAALQLDIEPGWHINSNTPLEPQYIPTHVEIAEHPHLEVLATRYPAGSLYRFAFSNDPLDVLEGTVFIYVELRAAGDAPPGVHELTGALRVQACNDAVCLPPRTKLVALEIPVVDPSMTIASSDSDIFSPARMYTLGAGTPQAGWRNLDVATLFGEGRWLFAFLGLFVLGLALNLTPCVYPMLAVTVSLFGGQTEASTSRAFGRAVVFVLGICTMYSVLGVMAALSGGLFGAALQSPWVLGGIGVLFVALALSMFGLYELQAPSWLISRLGGTTTTGTLGIYLAGLVVGVFAAPCIGPPIIALLAFVGQQGDPLFGFASFFVLSLGLGAPYVVLGTSSGLLKRLPRSGMWMVWVKKVFGVVLIAVAAFYLSLALNPDLLYYLVPVVLVAGGIYLGFVEATRGRPVFTWLKRAVGTTAVIAGVAFFLIGQRPSLDWEPHAPARLAAAQEAGSPVALYFAADWCLPCLELDRRTFTDRRVIETMEPIVRLKVDLTNFDAPESAAMREQFDISGVPIIVFLDARGQEWTDMRVEGFVDADDLLRRAQTMRALVASGW
jgi:thioredoxin:protein disulfide reductase